MKPTSRVAAVFTSVLLAGTLAACGSSGSNSGGAYGTPSSATSAGATSSAPTSTSVTVATASAALGKILVDGKGMTLYLFTKDTKGSGKSVCAGGCLAAWPPLLGTPKAGSGVDATKLGTLTRDDGSRQVTYNGWPLYFWAQDSKPGDVTGQNVQGVWFVVSPQGDAIK